MVSTRGVKVKFYEGERVLCYEPDPTKAKVLYDSKVLEIVTNKDHRGKKSIEYLIHFQGWNSSWDRCVSEEYVLKDTPENRQLQKDLAEKSQLQFGTYLYRRERKKCNRKTNERVTSEDDGNCSSPSRMDTDDGQEPSSSSDEESSIEDDIVPVNMPSELKEILNLDFLLINTKQKLAKLPAEPNVVTILENYYKHYTSKQLCLTEKNNARYRPSFNQPKPISSEDLARNQKICKEVVDGLRIYFDFTLNDLLLYKSEQAQFQTVPALYSQKLCDSFFKNDDSESLNCQPSTANEGHSHHNDHDHGDKKKSSKKRNLRSNTNNDTQTNGVASPEGSFPGLKINTEPSENVNPDAKILSWKLLPEHVYYQQPPPPCLVYGAIHLTRLLVKLPELVATVGMPDDKLKVLMKHLDFLAAFLNGHKEWFGEKCYIDLETNLK